jgi:DNA-directed RNA polymerase subunit RPC12/RpoP
MANRLNKYESVDVFYIRETAKAYLLKIVFDGKEVWFPKKLVFDLDKRGGLQRVKIAEFILIQKGYKDYGIVDTVIYRKWECFDCGAKGSKRVDISRCPECGSYRLWQEGGRENRQKVRLAEYTCGKCGRKERINIALAGGMYKCSNCGGEMRDWKEVYD